MTKTSFSSDLFTAATLHLDVLDDFIAIAQAKLARTDNAFAQDSLTDLLATLTEQRAGYLAFAAPSVTAVAA